MTPRSNGSITSHTVVTPARNEAENLTRLGQCLIDQTWQPSKWIVVDNGSTDETCDVVRRLGATHSWISLISIPPAKRPVRGSASVRAFNAGIIAEQPQTDLVTNADADISFDPTYFESLRDEFATRVSLGIASGLCYELEDGVWEPVHVTYPHLRGAARTYRRTCLEQLLPLEERLGWDGIDAIRANVRGWETGTLAALSYFHHRQTGARDVSRFAAFAEEGDSAYYTWYRPSYLFMRTAYRMVRSRDAAASGLLWGYARSAARRSPRQAETGFREFVRGNQSLANWFTRAREARGRR